MTIRTTMMATVMMLIMMIRTRIRIIDVRGRLLELEFSRQPAMLTVCIWMREGAEELWRVVKGGCPMTKGCIFYMTIRQRITARRCRPRTEADVLVLQDCILLFSMKYDGWMVVWYWQGVQEKELLKESDLIWIAFEYSRIYIYIYICKKYCQSWQE